MKTPTPWSGLMLAGLLTTSAVAAFEAGGFVYTKRQETVLLAAPQPLAEAAATLPYGRKLTIAEVSGAWLRVSEGAAAGWVFRGNVTATKPAEVKGLLDGVPQLASQTTATAAARPLAPAAATYATGNNLESAQADLEWLLAACAELTLDEVETYLQANRKGAYQ
ncbi:hypothetical protein Verru16b_01157 [Lacunisphaera limnophila]|uniref:Bacterial SH3 domain protein n=1 Tax=Lacunisphaera limnophila TaxID=1838286 RepID=A0A1D8ATC5_9BACT|nr:hypothetical protein [Lacunisphaera limnophila]AOS44096.1 hypothetical protein Verru16b_01157 [Lacunisphaera limnophila]